MVEAPDRSTEGHAGDGPEDWDRRYADGGRRLWSGEPNSALLVETGHLEPGTALDVGCGEGADAIWLALQGWKVTAVDISAVALDRARAAAASVGAEVDWVCADVPEEQLPSGSYDLVSAMYPAFRHTPGDDAIRALLDAVAPGGTLIVVHHSLDGHAGHRPSGFDPGDYVQPSDVAARLEDGWTIETDEERARVRPAGSPGPDRPDIVLRARRTG